MSSAFVFIILISIFVSGNYARTHEERHKLLVEEFKKHHPKAIWTPHINPVFKGKDENYFQRFLMRQGKLPPPNPSNLAIERENLKKIKARPLFHHNVIDPTTSNLLFLLRNTLRLTLAPPMDTTEESDSINSQPNDLGVERPNPILKGRKKRSATLLAPPTSFDYRQNSSCRSLHDIRQQGCGDCWAVAAAAAFSDTKCLYTGRNVFFSAKQLVSCVYTNRDGCSGGLPLDAAIYVRDNGIMTGGDPSTGEPYGCVTYDNVDYGMSCPVQCDNGQTMTPVKAFQALHLISGDVNMIQTYIFNYGPMVASFETYSDFQFADPYGVYQQLSGTFNGTRHAIRVIGWGIQDGVPYWLLANSWGTGFGDNGYIKFLRGSNHCGIESSLTVMTPMEANIG